MTDQLNQRLLPDTATSLPPCCRPPEQPIDRVDPSTTTTAPEPFDLTTTTTAEPFDLTTTTDDRGADHRDHPRPASSAVSEIRHLRFVANEGICIDCMEGDHDACRREAGYVDDGTTTSGAAVT